MDNYLDNSIVQIQEGWNRKGRKIWKKLNQKSGRHTNGKDEFKHAMWKIINAEPRKMKEKLKFATFNVQGLNTLGKRQEIEKWMKEK